MALAEYCGYDYSGILDILLKTILLLERKANVACRDPNDVTVLHAVLSCERRHEGTSKARSYRSGVLWSWKLSITAPKDMLILFISAGADVFAMTKFNQTPYMVARDRNRLREWEGALFACGYDAAEVQAHSHFDRQHCTYHHQVPKLTLEECCERLKKREQRHPPEGDAYSVLWRDVDIASLGYNEDEYDIPEIYDTSENDENSDMGEDDEEGSIRREHDFTSADFSTDNYGSAGVCNTQDGFAPTALELEEATEQQASPMDNEIAPESYTMDIDLDEGLEYGNIQLHQGGPLGADCVVGPSYYSGDTFIDNFAAAVHFGSRNTDDIIAEGFMQIPEHMDTDNFFGFDQYSAELG